MAFGKVTLALGFLVVLCVVSTVFAEEEKTIKCYICNTKDCEDKDSNLKECKGKCYIKKITDGWDRGCQTGDTDICKDAKEDTCSTCTKDECNSASGIASSLALSAVAVLLLKAFY